MKQSTLTSAHQKATDPAVPAREDVPLAADDPGALAIEVTNETSLAAARRLGAGTACLVFASAKNPWGGFLNGAQAQEESIARASALTEARRATR